MAEGEEEDSDDDVEPIAEFRFVPSDKSARKWRGKSCLNFEVWLLGWSFNAGCSYKLSANVNVFVLCRACRCIQALRTWGFLAGSSTQEAVPDKALGWIQEIWFPPSLAACWMMLLSTNSVGFGKRIFSVPLIPQSRTFCFLWGLGGEIKEFFITAANWRETGSIFRSATCPQGGCVLFPQWKPCSQPCVNARLCTPTQKTRIQTTITKGRSTTLRHAVRKSCFFWGKNKKQKPTYLT